MEKPLPWRQEARGAASSGRGELSRVPGQPGSQAGFQKLAGKVSKKQGHHQRAWVMGAVPSSPRSTIPLKLFRIAGAW